jgi:thiosulfate/3-mercaptopyruvate sulfurtransferase
LEEVQQAVDSGETQIIDVRTPEYYLGLKHKAEKVAAKGHIEGAKNLPFLVYVKESGEGSTFYPKDELQRIVNELGLDANQPVISHCNTGHLASSGWFVMQELLGNQDAQLYVGSMNEWAADPKRAVSTSLQ